MLLALVKVPEFFLLKHLHPAALESLSDEHFENGVNLIVEVEEFAVPDLGELVDAIILRHIESYDRFFNIEVGLRVFLVAGRLVC